MREARIILPKADNHGQPLDLAHADLARALCRNFGGATATATRGMWVSDDGKLYDEPGIAYDVAMDDTPANREIMRALAVAYGRRCGQEAMYVRYASGDVAILDTRTSIREVAA